MEIWTVHSSSLLMRQLRDRLPRVQQSWKTQLHFKTQKRERLRQSLTNQHRTVFSLRNVGKNNFISSDPSSNPATLFCICRVDCLVQFLADADLVFWACDTCSGASIIYAAAQPPSQNPKTDADASSTTNTFLNVEKKYFFILWASFVGQLFGKFVRQFLDLRLRFYAILGTAPGRLLNLQNDEIWGIKLQQQCTLLFYAQSRLTQEGKDY